MEVAWGTGTSEQAASLSPGRPWDLSLSPRRLSPNLPVDEDTCLLLHTPPGQECGCVGQGCAPALMWHLVSGWEGVIWRNACPRFR